jgi:hypothetical protein
MYAIIIQDSKKLFTYPYSCLLVHNQLIDEDGKVREEIQQQWRIFTVCKPKKGLALILKKIHLF